MDLNLTKNATAITELATFFNVRRTHPNPVVHVIGIEKMKRQTYKLLLSDGVYFHDAYVDNNTTVIKVLDVNVIGTKCDIIGDPKPFPYSATPSVEDCCHDSLLPDEHPGSCTTVEDYSHDSLPEDEHPLLKGSWISVEEQLESGSETEDGFIMLEEGLDY
ncbi:hypothetical protein Tco_0831803 [Tanacetum coccineum]